MYLLTFRNIVYIIYIQYLRGGETLNIIIRNTGDVPIYEQIAEQIKRAIVTGEISEGETLPSMRLLAKELRISLITTKRAYEELEREGFIVTMTGRGSFVAPQNMELLREEHLRNAERHLAEAIRAARTAGIGLQELQESLRILYDEDSTSASPSEL